MIKKLTLLAMAIAAIGAFAVPAMASAAQALTMPAGTLVSPGTGLVGTSHNTTTATSLGKLECETVELTGEVTENSGTTFAGKGSGSTSGKCFLVKGETKKEIKITHIVLNSLMSEEGSKANVNFSFEADLPTITCTFSTGAGGVTATYVNGGSVLKLTNQTLGGGACGNGTINGEFTVTTDPASLGNIILDS
jgi:hypothetical protein